jgi:hypothetical protein
MPVTVSVNGKAVGAVALAMLSFDGGAPYALGTVTTSAAATIAVSVARLPDVRAHPLTTFMASPLDVCADTIGDSANSALTTGARRRVSTIAT